MAKLVLMGRTNASVLFDWQNRLVARRVKTGLWLAAQDVGIWDLIKHTKALEKAYAVWLRTASKWELKAARLNRKKHS